MAGLVFLGYALIGLGPALAILITQIIRKPFLVLIALSSSFCWLVALILLALLWRPFFPNSLTPFTGFVVLLSSVVVAELHRQHFFLECLRWLEEALNQLADVRGLPKLSLLDKVTVSAASGFGHAAAHAVFFFLSITTPALGAATLYLDVCPVAPFFLVVAVLSAAFTVIHTTSFITSAALSSAPKEFRSLSFSADTSALLSSQCQEEQDHSLLHPSWNLPSWANSVLVPALHMTAAASTLVNFVPGGCFVGIPLVWMCAVVACVLCYLSLDFSKRYTLSLRETLIL